MSASPTTKLVLAFRSGDRCAFSGCGKSLTVDGSAASDPVVTGEAAHIAGEKPSSARYDPSMTDAQRNHYDNLIYLCGDHHTQIDKQHGDFSVDCLLKMKAKHEAQVQEVMTDAFADVGFPELEEATQWILRLSPATSPEDYSLIPLEAKIKKNDLGNGARAIITMGIGVSREVKSYVETVSQTSPDFSDRLKVGFLQEYYRLKKEGVSGEDLFELMCRFSQRGFDNQAQKSAGLAVLIYLFEVCEVFEK